jgi:5-hydroxyisourate hydrolase-like protein (transthyretin family)
LIPFRSTIVSFGLVAAAGAFSVSAATFRPLRGDAPCEVHLLSLRGGAEVAAPCGAPVTVPPGDYDAWLEDGARITPFPTRVSIAAGDTREYRWPLEPAGSLKADAAELIRVENTAARLFRRPTDGQPRRMPLGRAVAVRRDDRGEPVAVSRPVAIAAGAPAEARPAAPAKDADLFVVLERPANLDAGDVALMAAIGEERLRADVLATTADHVVAIWYGLPPGRAEVTAMSSTLRLEPQWTTLRAQRLGSIRAALVPLPSLRVTVTIPSDALGKDDTLSLKISDPKHPEGARELAAVEPNVVYDLHALPAAPLEVELNVGKWPIRRTVDLSSGNDDLLVIELEPLVVSGTVTYGEEPAEADVGFSADTLFETRTDEEGRYRITLWEPRRYGMRVKLRKATDVPPFVDTVRVSGSGTFDVAIPRARYRVRVLNQETGQPVPEARVTLTNTWQDPVEGRRRSMLQLTTDATGEALLPPLRAGSVDLRADAEGYLTATAENQPVADGKEEVRLEVRMHASGSASEVKVVLPGGAPAAGADWIAVRGERVVLHGTVPESGTIQVPNALEGALLVARHQTATGLRIAAGQGGATWPLLPVAPPLTVHAVDASGRPAGSAPIVVWTAGQRLSGVALAFLVGTGDATSIDGTWLGRNLPAAPLRILINKRGTAAAAIESGAFDAVAQQVPYPWPGAVTVRIAE